MKDPLDPGTDDIEHHTTPGFVRERGADWQQFRAAQRSPARVAPPPQIPLPFSGPEGVTDADR